MLALREGLCLSSGNEQGKQGGTAESYFTDPVLVDNTQGRGRFVLSPFRKWSGFFIYNLGRPLQGKEYRYENHE